MIQPLFQEKYSYGFTLIEILVAITISVIMLGMAIAGYIKFEQVQRVQQTARDVQQRFSETRRKAQIKDQTGCQPALGPNGSLYGEVTDYQIKIIDDSPMMRVSQITSCADPIISPSDYPVTEYFIPSSITVTANASSISPEMTLTYLPLDTTATITSPCATTTPCEIKFSDGSTEYKFDILPGGLIGSVQKL